MATKLLASIKNNLSIKAGSIYLLSNILIKGIVLLTIPLFTDILSTSEYGLFTKYMTIESIMSIIISIGIDGAIRNAIIDFKKDFNDFLASSMGMVFALFITLTLIISLLFTFEISLFGLNYEMSLLVVLHSFATAIFTIFTVKITLEYKYKIYAFLSLIQSVLSIALSLFFILCVFKNNRDIGRIIGYSVPIILISLIIFIRSVLISKQFYSYKIWKYCLTIGTPFMVHKLSHIVLSQFDRVMISEMVGLNETGIYGVAYTFGSAFQILWVAFDTVWTPWIYSKLEQGKSNEIKKSMRKYILFVSLLFLCGTSVLIELYSFMTNDSYNEGIFLILPISLSVFFIFLYSFYVQVENYYKKTKYSAFGTFFAAIINIILNYVFINVFGYYAAVYTTVATYLLLFLFHRIICINILHLKYVNEKSIFSALFIVSIVVSLYMLLINNFIIRFIIGLTIGILLLIFCFNYIKNNKDDENAKQSSKV